MWRPDENKDAYASENGGRPESWWPKPSASGEQIDSILCQYLQTTEGGSEGKASTEDQTRSFRAKFEPLHSVGSPILHQGPGLDVMMGGGHLNSWPRQECHETSGTPTDADSGNDGLKKFGDEDVVKEVGDGGCINQTRVDGAQRGVVGSGNGGGGGSYSSGTDSGRHFASDAQKEQEIALDPLESAGDLDSPNKTSASIPLGCLVKPKSPNKQGSSSPVVVDISPPIDPQPQPRLPPHAATTTTTTSSSSSPSSLTSIPTSSARLNPSYLTNSTSRRPPSAVQQYRILDERQAKRPPLWRRRVNYKNSFSEKEEMLATARPHAYDISNTNTTNDPLRYQATHAEASYFTHREPSATDHGDLFPLSPPLSSARSSFLCSNNNVAPHHLNGNYNLSTESLPSNVETNAINLLSRPHSTPQLQEQMENPYSSTQTRQFLNPSPSHEYLSPENSFDDGNMMKPHQPLSAYSSFNAPCPIAEPLDLENAEDSASSSAQGSSPQTWWGPNANLDFTQDSSTLIYPTTSAPTPAATAFQSLPNMSPKRRFNQTPSNDNLRNLLYTQQQQQPRSPMIEADHMYAHLLSGQHPNSAMPSPPGSPGYFFPAQLSGDGFCTADGSGVSFIDPFHNSAAHHAPQPHQQFNTFPRRNPLQKSMLGYDAAIQSTPPIPIRTVPSHGHSNGNSRSSYLRKTGSLGRSARMPPIGKSDPKEVSFVNFTPHDATKILSGVAPSGSSKTKARREREAQEKRRKLSEAAAAAVLAAGGDPKAITEMEF
ncbi:hypothetical protein ABW19_dt0208133 [Dactylella cylindrospora]|nr:hypothetical protein ABW19_dt0208133 [Dactylella cylindrospora]